MTKNLKEKKPILMKSNLVLFILMPKSRNIEKKVRQDLIESSTFLLGLDDLLKAYKKSLCLNKNIKKEIGFETIAAYKRSSNILNTEEKMSTDSLGFADPGLFKNDYEKKLYKKTKTSLVLFSLRKLKFLHQSLGSSYFQS